MLLPLPIEAYLKVWRPSDLQMSADARWVAYAASEPMVEKPVPAVYVVEVATGKSHRISLGKEGAAHPRFAPDGRTLLFRAGEGLYRVGVGGGRPRRETTLPKGTGSYEVSPDGTRIAYAAPVREEPKKEAGPRVVDADEIPSGLFVASLKDPKPRRARLSRSGAPGGLTPSPMRPASP